MKELLKSFGYAVAGMTAVVVITSTLIWGLEALLHANSYLRYGVVVVLVLMLLAGIVHLFRTGN